MPDYPDLVPSGYSSLEEFMSEYWYYTIEVAPDLFTPGENHPNIIPTRSLINRLDPMGAKVLDIGTMEAMIPILMARNGANVTAIDAGDFTRKIEALKQIYGVSFDYHGRVALGSTKRFLHEKNVFEGFLKDENPKRGYDVVVLSGVLYHVFSPFEVMALARTCLRRNGILIVETAASRDDSLSQKWNYDGNKWIYPNGTNTWFVTCRLMDHFLRLLRFRVLDCAHIPNYGEISRVAVVAQAIDDPLPLKAEEEWFLKTTRNFDYDFSCDIDWAQGDAHEVGYQSGDVVLHPDIESVDVHAMVTTQPPTPQSYERIRLHLTDFQ